jgi:hypothetical protein
VGGGRFGRRRGQGVQGIWAKIRRQAPARLMAMQPAR